MRRSISVAMIVCASGAASAAHAKTDARAEILNHTIFLHDAAVPWADLPIVKAPGRRVLARIPPAKGEFAMIELRCDGLRPNGMVFDCKVRTEPAGEAYGLAGRAAVADIRVDKTYARSVQGKVRFLMIMIRVSNSSVPAFKGPCWPPSCVLEPGPPPPRP